ncbi:hypothetical protein X777_08753, partial [Ooceraea biroi]
TPDSYRSIVTKFDVGKAAAWRAVQRVVHVLCNYRNHFIRWPNEREANECSRVLQMQYGFPGVIGALDGTHINISTPAQDSQSYINRKGKHSIQLQTSPMRRTDQIPLYIISCCALHNICLLQDDDFEYPIIIDDDINADPDPIIINQLLLNEGSRKRENIKNSLLHFCYFIHGEDDTAKLVHGCMQNGGIYIKVGQGLAAVNHILPKEYIETLSALHARFRIHRLD